MKQKAVIVDIDGTVAIRDDELRDPFTTEFDKLVADTPQSRIVDLVALFFNNDYKIIYVTGRDGQAEEGTREWLRLYTPPYAHLYMRTPNDMRKDTLVKREIYKSKIEPHYDVHYVLDDRNQVVDMWREIGLVCLQVAPGDF